ncbi:spidroin 4A variant 1 [Nephila pilipes]|uniref:Spidroin 4A variant 1 n=1 Tax=Nephila pilipes TaxID=299642 RepID=A0A8X6UUM4_NEPPI|nr:spidroin 4A variant 1 [Nephila pilipes]
MGWLSHVILWICFTGIYFQTVHTYPEQDSVKQNTVQAPVQSSQEGNTSRSSAYQSNQQQDVGELNQDQSTPEQESEQSPNQSNTQQEPGQNQNESNTETDGQNLDQNNSLQRPNEQNTNQNNPQKSNEKPSDQSNPQPKSEGRRSRLKAPNQEFIQAPEKNSLKQEPKQIRNQSDTEHFQPFLSPDESNLEPDGQNTTQNNPQPKSEGRSSRLRAPNEEFIQAPEKNSLKHEPKQIRNQSDTEHFQPFLSPDESNLEPDGQNTTQNNPQPKSEGRSSRLRTPNEEFIQAPEKNSLKQEPKQIRNQSDTEHFQPFLSPDESDVKPEEQSVPQQQSHREHPNQSDEPHNLILPHLEPNGQYPPQRSIVNNSNDPLGFNDIGDKFAKIFVKSVIDNPKFGKGADTDFTETTFALTNAINLLRSAHNAPKEQKRTIMIAFAATISELIVIECRDRLTIEEKVSIIINALKKAYMETTGYIDYTLLREITYLVIIFLGESKTRPEIDIRSLYPGFPGLVFLPRRFQPRFTFDPALIRYIYGFPENFEFNIPKNRSFPDEDVPGQNYTVYFPFLEKFLEEVENYFPLYPYERMSERAYKYLFPELYRLSPLERRKQYLYGYGKYGFEPGTNPYEFVLHRHPGKKKGHYNLRHHIKRVKRPHNKTGNPEYIYVTSSEEKTTPEMVTKVVTDSSGGTTKINVPVKTTTPYGSEKTTPEMVTKIVTDSSGGTTKINVPVKTTTPYGSENTTPIEELETTYTPGYAPTGISSGTTPPLNAQTTEDTRTTEPLFGKNPPDSFEIFVDPKRDPNDKEFLRIYIPFRNIHRVLHITFDEFIHFIRIHFGQNFTITRNHNGQYRIHVIRHRRTTPEMVTKVVTDSSGGTTKINVPVKTTTPNTSQFSSQTTPGISAGTAKESSTPRDHRRTTTSETNEKGQELSTQSSQNMLTVTPTSTPNRNITKPPRFNTTNYERTTTHGEKKNTTPEDGSKTTFTPGYAPTGISSSTTPALNAQNTEATRTTEPLFGKNPPDSFEIFVDPKRDPDDKQFLRIYIPFRNIHRVLHITLDEFIHFIRIHFGHNYTINKTHNGQYRIHVIRHRRTTPEMVTKIVTDSSGGTTKINVPVKTTTPYGSEKTTPEMMTEIVTDSSGRTTRIHVPVKTTTPYTGERTTPEMVTKVVTDSSGGTTRLMYKTNCPVCF